MFPGIEKTLNAVEEEQEEDLKLKRVFEIILNKRRKQIPMKYREIFNNQWFADHTRKRDNGTYEIRCSINKVPITGSGKDLDTAAENFIAALMRASASKTKRTEKAPEVKRALFNEFALQWCELIKKPTVKEITYNSVIVNLKAHVFPAFKRKYVDELTAMQIQPIFNKLVAEGKMRTANNVKLILNQIFNGAVAERLIAFNPMSGVKLLKHHSKNGTALTYEEERIFLEKLESSRFKLTFALVLFAGMRRAELASVRIEGGFVIVKDGKRRLSQIQTERKIPITPMLKRYLKKVSARELETAISYSCDQLSREFKKLCPEHHLHELRHTFITRCQECGVAREVVSVWAGHAADNTMTSMVYTHFSEEFMLSEGEKVDYYNRLK